MERIKCIDCLAFRKESNKCLIKKEEIVKLNICPNRDFFNMYDFLKSSGGIING